jgi:hypothetical protein
VKAGGATFVETQDEDEEEEARVNTSADKVEKSKREQSGKSRQWCYRHGLQEQRMYEMAKLRAQLQQVISKMQVDMLQETKNGMIQQRNVTNSGGGGRGGRGGGTSPFDLTSSKNNNDKMMMDEVHNKVHQRLDKIKTSSSSSSSSSSSLSLSQQSRLIKRLKHEAAQSDSSIRVLTLADSETNKLSGEGMNDDDEQAYRTSVDPAGGTSIKKSMKNDTHDGGRESGGGRGGGGGGDNSNNNNNKNNKEDEDAEDEDLALDEGRQASAVLDDIDLHNRMDLSGWYKKKKLMHEKQSKRKDGSRDGDVYNAALLIEDEKNEQELAKLVMLVGLYPNIAVVDPHNATRPLNEHQVTLTI